MSLSFTPKGANFSVFSRHATAMWFCQFAKGNETQTPLVKTGEVFSGLIANLKPGDHYGLRADGPWNEAIGHRFDKSKLLLDPYTLELTAHLKWHPDLATRGIDTAKRMPKCVARTALPTAQPLSPRPPNFILEVNVKAFSNLNFIIPEKLRGTVAALAHPASIAHFKRIGCDCIELMPITAWTDERHLAPLGLTNAWGYNPISYFAPEPNLAPGGMVEIRDTIEALHKEGIRVLLDVVYNHTGESDFGGATVFLRGLDNKSYYRMDGPHLINDSGCGNSLNLHESPAQNLALDSLRHLANLGFDGFRYDLAPALGRLPHGFSPQAPLLQAIQSDEILKNLIHIAEPWDIGPGGYHLGNFPANWLEWNDKYRDDMRKFWRGSDGNAPAFNANDAATRLSGSADLFQSPDRKASSSVNFIAAHDGFSLADVVRYNTKFNLANGENNRDGSSHEICWIDTNPVTKIKAMLAGLFFARGTIMLYAGDEFGATRQGNNNAYAQDNKINWLDWENASEDLINYIGTLSRLRQTYADYFNDEFLTGKPLRKGGHPDIVWFDESGAEITEWYGRSTLGLCLASAKKPERLGIIFSPGHITAKFKLPLPQIKYTWKNITPSKDEMMPLFQLFIECRNK